MAVFSTNQVRQLYVATDVKASTANVLTTDAAGSIALKYDSAKKHMYFEYMSMGGLVRSDLIDIDNVLYAKATDASAMARPIKKKAVTLDSSVNSGSPIAGQDYILRITLRQYLGMSDEDQYQKYGMVHAYTGMSASDFYKTLAMSLAKNFSRELVPLLKFYVSSTANSTTTLTEVKATTKLSDLSSVTAENVTIEEVEQPWTLGIQPETPVYFDVNPGMVSYNSDEFIWGTVTDKTPKQQAKSTGTGTEWSPALVTTGTGKNAIGNGKTIADLEYFCLGERADQYRNIGWPNSTPSKTMVDPTKDYYVLDIHYAYTGANECVQKSEKTITIVSDTKSEINTLVTAFNTATGMSVASL